MLDAAGVLFTFRITLSSSLIRVTVFVKAATLLAGLARD